MSVNHVNAATFQKEVLENEKPVLLDFWATWCGPCRMLSPILDEIAEEREDIAVCKVNVDEAPELARRFGIVSIPTLIVMQNGREEDRVIGVKFKNQLLELFD